MEHHDRHVKVWRFLHPIVRFVLRIILNCRIRPEKHEGPYLVLCNHTMDWDPLIAGAGFSDQMYFVTSEHLMRQGFISKLLNWLQAPITRQKGGNAAGTVKAILRHLKAGYNVCFFPEGNRCWDGVTRPFPASTGKLVRSCGCRLITYRISGGYFASPRWTGSKLRRGKVDGKVVGSYSPEELRAMSAEEINELIARDIYEDAYATQEKEPVKFKGTKLAQHLESLLFSCPKCGAMHRMKSRGNSFSCLECGMKTEFTPSGYFEGGELPFRTVLQWNLWQEERIKELCESAGEEPIFTDSEMELHTVESAKGLELVGQGEVKLYRNRIELPGDVVLDGSEIGGMSMRGAQHLYIGTFDGKHYMLKGKSIRCTVKYLSAAGYLGFNVGAGV